MWRVMPLQYDHLFVLHVSQVRREDLCHTPKSMKLSHILYYVQHLLWFSCCCPIFVFYLNSLCT